MRLQSKVAIITGGASGIGFAAARKFKEEGAIVIIADYNETLANTVASNLQVDAFKLDVRNRDDCVQLAQFVIDKYGKIDILVNNAGITKDRMLHKMDESDFDEVLDVNCKGVFNMTQAVVPFMREASSGKIINTSSIVGVNGNIGQTNYAASKAAVIGMTKTWAKELGKKGINVNAVAPGFIETDMVKTIPADQLMMMKMIISLGSLGRAEDVANAYLFLASDESRYITGHTLHVDGGMMG
ncbi:MAG: beta-ketoacyl-ACP reductase [Lysinibacillus sp.]